MYHCSSHCMTVPTLSFAAPCTTSGCASATRRIRCPPSDSSPAPTLQRRPRSPEYGAARLPPPQLPDDLARAPTVFVRRDGHVPPLQPLYDGPYTVICRSLHHFTLCIGDKVDKVSTLRLKPCMDPTAPPALPRVRGRPPAAIRF